MKQAVLRRTCRGAALVGDTAAVVSRCVLSSIVPEVADDALHHGRHVSNKGGCSPIIIIINLYDYGDISANPARPVE